MSEGGLSKTALTGIFVGLLLFIAEGINYSQLAPFFPTEAEYKKDLSPFMVGVISSSFDFSNLVFTVVLATVATPQLNKFFFIWGGIFGAVSNICFGVLGLGPGGWVFAIMSLCTRILMGIGAGMIWATGVPLLTAIAPAYSGRITSSIESGVGLGFAIGPPIGSLAYSLGGYIWPFVISGGLELIIIFVAILTIQNVHSTSSAADTSDLNVQVDNKTHYDDKMLNPEGDEEESSSSEDVESLLQPGSQVGESEGKKKEHDDTMKAFMKLIE